MRVRFGKLTSAVNESVDTNDAFGLREVQGNAEVNPAFPNQFAFPRSSEKHEAFMQWFRTQVNNGILESGTFNQVGSGVDAAWTNKYIFDSYKRGVMRARYELKKAGFQVPTIEASGGINVAMGVPLHIDTLGLLYTRVFSDLQGITAAMDTQVSRILAEGLANGDGPALLSRKIIATVDGAGMGELGITDSLGRFIPAKRRAEMLARTETIRAHHQATINEYKNYAAEGVVVKAEWMTAQDSRVCADCEAKEGEIFPLNVAFNMIPLHPNCRCIALPYRASMTTKKAINTL